MKIVVCNKLRLINRENDKFTKEFTKTLRTGVKITESDMNGFNAVYGTSGIFYELDEKATAERDMKLSGELSRDELKAKADELGIEYPSNIKTEKLKTLIEK